MTATILTLPPVPRQPRLLGRKREGGAPLAYLPWAAPPVDPRPCASCGEDASLGENWRWWPSAGTAACFCDDCAARRAWSRPQEAGLGEGAPSPDHQAD